MFKRLSVLVWSSLVASFTILAARAEPEPGTGVRLAEWQTAAGERCAYDGTFYSYVNETGQGIKIWIPPTGRPVRGLILLGNPGGDFGGDTRDKTRQLDLLEFAAWHDFAVGGVNGFPALRVYEHTGRFVLAACEAWGAHGKHPELAHIPFIFGGGSNAGGFSVAMMLLAPERTIAITPNVGPLYRGTVTDATREVPAWMHIGTIDPLFPQAVEQTENFFARSAGNDARWTWEAEIKGHENGSADEVDLAFWDAVIPLRLPAAQEQPRAIKLQPIPYERGWWTDQRSWDHAIANVGPATEAKPGPHVPGRFGWVPSEGIARIYQAAATRARPITLSVETDRRATGGAATGVYLSSTGGRMAAPGESVTLRVHFAPLQSPPATIELYDLAEKIGEIEPAKSTEFSYRLPGGRAVHVFHARASVRSSWSDRPSERVSNPVQVVVRHPEYSARIERQLRAVAFPNRLFTRDPEPVARAAESPTGPALTAVRVSAETASLLLADDARDEAWDKVPRTAIGGEPAATVQAAWGDGGLLLRFRTRVAANGKPGASEKPRCDFHLARASLADVEAGPADTRLYAAPRRHSVLRSALQFSVLVNSDEPATVGVNRWEPWDCVATQLDPAEDYAGTGLKVRRRIGADGTRSVDFFVPWPLVGNPGFTRAPEPGTSLATVLSCTAGDERVFWPKGRNPWATTPSAPMYGQIILSP